MRILSLFAAMMLLAPSGVRAQQPAADVHAQGPPPASPGTTSKPGIGAAMPIPATNAFTAQTCASCHPSQARTQPFTPMAQALQLPATNKTLKTHPVLAYHRGAYSYSVATTGESSIYSVTDGTRTLSSPVKWGIGLGGQTWVLERDGKLYESLVSFYPAIDGLDITTGDEILKPATLEEAMGRELPPQESKPCFGCHTTNALAKGKLSLATLQPGVTCLHCHEGALVHAEDANNGVFDTAPARLGRQSSEKISNFCGQCHRTWEFVTRNNWRGPQNVRFQPYRLANSRCFDGTDPRISCVACHNPHQDLVRTSTAYDAKCVACHAPPLVVASVRADDLKTPGLKREQARVCPVAKSNCVSCHMPKVVFPGGGGHLTFTDHQIRVVKPGDAYPN